jgi:ATP-dependent Lon protease
MGNVAHRAFVELVLGTPKYRPELAERKLLPGVATALAAGAAGGELLFIEATEMPGKGNVQFTGGLKPVMKESAATAVSYVRSRADRLLLDPEWLKSIDLHLHVPRGSAARDAAGLGVPIFASVASLLLRVATRPEVAAVGEITLRGVVLPVGSVKDKVLAAHRAGVLEIVLPARNEADLDDVPSEILNEVQIHLVKHVDEVLKWMLERPPTGSTRAASQPSDPPTEMRP